MKLLRLLRLYVDKAEICHLVVTPKFPRSQDQIIAKQPPLPPWRYCEISGAIT